MKIGILTFHRAHNYGAVLQCYALQEVIKSLGYDTNVIDYRTSGMEKDIAVFSISKLLRLLKHPSQIYGYLRSMPHRLKQSRNYLSFQHKYLNLISAKKGIPQNIDVYLVGSDQVWSYNEEVYTGFFQHSSESRICGYAISANLSLLDNYESDLDRYMDTFDVVSCREQSICDYLYQKTGKASRLDIDPTLLAPQDIWQPMINSKWSSRNYILLYQVRAKDPNILKQKAINLAEKNGFELIDLSDNKLPVEDFISAFKFAKCVLTSSFHGTVFSLIFERPVYVFRLGDSGDSRYVELLTRIDAESFLFNLNANIDKIPTNDFAQIRQNLDKLRLDSINYLKSFKDNFIIK